jgi:hypothetical protein
MTPHITARSGNQDRSALQSCIHFPLPASDASRTAVTVRPVMHFNKFCFPKTHFPATIFYLLHLPKNARGKNRPKLQCSHTDCFKA